MGSGEAAAVVPPPSRAVGARRARPAAADRRLAGECGALRHRRRSRRCATIWRRSCPPGGALLVGGDRYEFDREPPVAHNSLFVLGRRRRGAGPLRQGRSGAVRRVPAVPRRARPARPAQADRRLDRLHARARAGSTLQLAGLPPASPLICYEAAFPGAGDRSRASGRPGWSTSPTTPGSAAARARTSIWPWRGCARSRKACRWCAPPTPASRWSPTPMAASARGSASNETGVIDALSARRRCRRPRSRRRHRLAVTSGLAPARRGCA